MKPVTNDNGNHNQPGEQVPAVKDSRQSFRDKETKKLVRDQAERTLWD